MRWWYVNCEYISLSASDLSHQPVPDSNLSWFARSRYCYRKNNAVSHGTNLFVGPSVSFARDMLNVNLNLVLLEPAAKRELAVAVGRQSPDLRKGEAKG